MRFFFIILLIIIASGCSSRELLYEKTTIVAEEKRIMGMDGKSYKIYTKQTSSVTMEVEQVDGICGTVKTEEKQSGYSIHD